MTEYPKNLRRMPKEVINELKPQELKELRLLLSLPDSIHQLRTSITECSKAVEEAFYQSRLDDNLALLEKLSIKYNIFDMDMKPTLPNWVESPEAFEEFSSCNK